MTRLAAYVAAVAGLSVGANAQLIRMLVSRDGVSFTPSVWANPGDTVQVLVTVSYTGSASSVAGFGSANFQPTVSNWHATDTLLPLRQGGNTDPADGSGMVQPQFYSGVTAGNGVPVQAGYTGGYGRVNPMGRTFLDGANALQGFVHNNPDGSGLTYLRIAQAVAPMWIGQPGNTSGGSGVNCAQLYIGGRTSSDPDFWGNQESVYVDDTDPSQGFTNSGRIAVNDFRRQNVELFRFAFRLDTSPELRDMIVDAPLAGQQMTDTSGVRYIGYYTNPTVAQPTLLLPVTVQTALIHAGYYPAPGTVVALGLCGLATIRRRRSGPAINT
jgi:hypothetical protein